MNHGILFFREEVNIAIYLQRWKIDGIQLAHEKSPAWHLLPEEEGYWDPS
jgi:hypothetical protein